MSLMSAPLGARDRVVVIGGGQGGLQVAVSLRERGFRGHIDLVAEEAHFPYQRPPLSKDYLTAGEHHLIHLRDESSLTAIGIAVHTSTQVVGIDREGSQVTLASGKKIGYDRLVLATGARARRPAIPGAHDDDVRTLRTRDDADRLVALLRDSRRVVSVGGGFIGLEVASALRAAGHDTTVVARGTRLMARSCHPSISSYMLDRHRAQGTEIHLDTDVDAITPGCESHHRVILSSGEEIAADVALIAVGVTPNVDLARDAGLLVADGIVVDSDLTTDDPSIFAIGDCVSFPSVRAGKRIRLESLQNAVDQAKAVADHLVTGESRPYDRTPWFWSNQCGVRLQMVGLANETSVFEIAGDPQAGKFSALLFEQGRLARVESVNDPVSHLAARKLMDAGAAVDLQTAHRFDLNLKAVAASMHASAA